MPELPEVEWVRRRLEPMLVSRRIVEGWGHPSAKFAEAPEAAGSVVTGLGRRGKYLLAALDDKRELIVHLGMTGWLRPHDFSASCDPYVRAWWRLDDGSAIELHDVRRFGRVAVVADGDHTCLPTLAALGPEPWDRALDSDGFWRRLRTSRARLKTQLLSQRPIAGVGNIYADEGLWRARVHPALRSITRTQASRLLAGVRDALETGLANGGTTLRDYRTPDGEPGRNQLTLCCYGRAGEACQRCGELLISRVYDGRTTTFCPTCQRR